MVSKVENQVRARILFNNSSENFLEGNVLEDSDNVIAVDDPMYGVCRMVKNDGITIQYLSEEVE